MTKDDDKDGFLLLSLKQVLGVGGRINRRARR